jgi:hypothetical protein
VPLIYAKEERIDAVFSDDELWQKIKQRESRDISRLRSVSPGSPEWIETTENLADRIDEVLSSFTQVEAPGQGDRHTPITSIEDTAPPGTLERMAALEDKIPVVIADLERIAVLMNSMNEEVVKATPKFATAETFNERLSISRSLAKKLDPIAAEMAATAERMVGNFSEWDLFVQYLADYAHKGGDLSEAGFLAAISGLWSLANTGGESLSPINEFAQQVTQVIGVSRDLDRPLMAIRDAALMIADMSGILDGWKEVLEALESEYFSAGFLAGLPNSSTRT